MMVLWFVNDGFLVYIMKVFKKKKMMIIVYNYLGILFFLVNWNKWYWEGNN